MSDIAPGIRAGVVDPSAAPAGERGPAATAGFTSFASEASPCLLASCVRLRRCRRHGREGTAAPAGFTSLTRDAAPYPRAGGSLLQCCRPRVRTGPAASGLRGRRLRRHCASAVPCHANSERRGSEVGGSSGHFLGASRSGPGTPGRCFASLTFLSTWPTGVGGSSGQFPGAGLVFPLGRSPGAFPIRRGRVYGHPRSGVHHHWLG